MVLAAPGPLLTPPPNCASGNQSRPRVLLCLHCRVEVAGRTPATTLDATVEHQADNFQGLPDAHAIAKSTSMKYKVPGPNPLGNRVLPRDSCVQGHVKTSSFSSADSPKNSHWLVRYGPNGRLRKYRQQMPSMVAPVTCACGPDITHWLGLPGMGPLCSGDASSASSNWASSPAPLVLLVPQGPRSNTQ
jgi:hypothetical protein